MNPSRFRAAGKYLCVNDIALPADAVFLATGNGSRIFRCFILVEGHMKKSIVAAALLLSAVGVAHAAAPARCFSPSEIEAEQAILFQTELMVLSETCRDNIYVSFLHRNVEQIKAYQKRMIDHFRRSGERRAESAFDSYVTRLANQSALRNGKMPVPSLCQEAKYLLTAGDAFDSNGFHQYASSKASSNLGYYRVCKE
jgi:hypothetical protein